MATSSRSKSWTDQQSMIGLDKVLDTSESSTLEDMVIQKDWTYTQNYPKSIRIGFTRVCLKIVYPYTQWLMIIIPTKWLFHWEYTLFSDKPTRSARFFLFAPADLFWLKPGAFRSRPADQPAGPRHQISPPI